MMTHFSSLKRPNVVLELEIAEPTSMMGFNVEHLY